MKSIDYPEANLALAKDQPEYQTLFVFVGAFPLFEMTACLELTEPEIAEIVATKKVWLTQTTFGKGFQPIRMSLSNPFQKIIVTSEVPMDENRVSVEQWDKTHYINSWISGTQGLGPCFNCGEEEQNHFWSSRQCSL